MFALSIRSIGFFDKRARRNNQRIDAKTDKVIDTMFFGARPRGIKISADGKNAYVAFSAPMNKKPKPGDEGITVINTRNGRVVKSINVGSDPEQLEINSNQTLLYVSNEDAGTATVTDIETGQPKATLIVGIEPEGAAISPDGRWIYVMAETSNTVTVIDTEKLQVTDTFLVGSRPRAAAFSPDGSKAYITSEVGQTLSVVDTANHQVIKTISLGFNENVKPVGVVVSLDGTRIYVAASNLSP